MIDMNERPTLAIRNSYVRQPVIVDGMMRVGKFYYDAVVSNMERCEIWQFNSLLETIPILNLVGAMDERLAVSLFRQEMDVRFYYGLLGRQTNFRFDDRSSIWHHHNPGEYFHRIFNKDESGVIENIDKSDAIFCLSLHDATANARFLFKAYPDLRLIYGRRNPLDVAYSWHMKNWGDRIGSDPRSVFLAFEGKKGPVPWHALGWSEKYENMSAMDRIIESIDHITKITDAEIECLAPKHRAQLLVVNFEHAAGFPEEFVAMVAQHIGTVPAHSMAKCLKDERMPRHFSRADWDMRAAEIRKHASAASFEKLLDMVARHHQNSIDRFAIDTEALRLQGT